ncbi:UTRA domain-containing protein, partial [Bacillus cereus]
VVEALGEKEGTALLKRMRYSYDEVGEVIEYSEGYYNTEMIGDNTTSPLFYTS